MGNLSLVLPFSALAGDGITRLVLPLKTADNSITRLVLPSSAIPDNGNTNLVIPFGALPGLEHLLYLVQHGSGGLLGLS